MSGDPQLELFLEKMNRMADDIADIRKRVDIITNDRDRLIRLEEARINHEKAFDRLFTSLTLDENRLTAIEAQQPINSMITKWVISGVLGVIGMVGMMIFMVITTNSKNLQPQEIRISIDKDGNANRTAEPK